MDTRTTIAELKEPVGDFVADRNWGSYHNPKNLAMSIAIEAAEILEHFQWLDQEASWKRVENPETRAEIADELADVLIYCLSFANQARIDLSDAIRAKLERNKARFPIGFIPTEQDEDS